MAGRLGKGVRGGRGHEDDEGPAAEGEADEGRGCDARRVRGVQGAGDDEAGPGPAEVVGEGRTRDERASARQAGGWAESAGGSWTCGCEGGWAAEGGGGM